MKHTEEVKELLQKALDATCRAEYYEQTMCLVAQKIGLQGEKRRMRYESVKCHNLINYLRTDAYDTYGIELVYDKTITAQIPVITNFESYYETVLGYYTSKYDTLHSIANKLVMANAREYACKLYHLCDCILSDIKYFKRTLREGRLAKWDPSWMLLHETTDYNVHDEYEKKEHEVGYNY